MASVGSLPSVAFGAERCGLLWHGSNTELPLWQPYISLFIFSIDKSFIFIPLPHTSPSYYWSLSPLLYIALRVGDKSLVHPLSTEDTDTFFSICWEAESDKHTHTNIWTGPSVKTARGQNLLHPLRSSLLRNTVYTEYVGSPITHYRNSDFKLCVCECMPNREWAVWIQQTAGCQRID